MEEPKDMLKATKISHWGVFIAYILMGEGVTIIFRPTIDSFQDDVLSELPSNSVIIQILRFSMAVVILATIPLITVPAGDFIYGKLPSPLRSYNSDRMMSIVRIMICLFSAYVSIEVPGFVNAISLTGCLSVASLSFVYPPLVHLVLQYKIRRQETCIFCLDIILLLWGIIATTISTTLIFQSMIT